MQGFGCWMQSEVQVESVGDTARLATTRKRCRCLGSRSKGTWFGFLGLGFRVWSLGFGVWSLGFGVWSLEFGV